MRTLEVATLESPIGPLGVAAEDGVLVAVTFDGLAPLRAWGTRVLGPSTWAEAPNIRGRLHPAPALLRR